MTYTFIGGVAHGQQIETNQREIMLPCYQPLAPEQVRLESETLTTEKRIGPSHRYRLEPFSVNGRLEYLMIYEKIEAQHVFGYLIASAIKTRQAFDRIETLLRSGTSEELLAALKQVAKI